MESVGISSAIHDPSRLFIHNHDLVFHYHVFNIFLKKGEGFKELIHGMDAFSFDAEVLEELFFECSFFFRFELLIFDFCNLTTNVR